MHSYVYHRAYSNSYLSPIVYFQILLFPWKRQAFYPRKIRAWHTTLSVTSGYRFRARQSREYKISAREGTHGPGGPSPAPACMPALSLAQWVEDYLRWDSLTLRRSRPTLCSPSPFAESERKERADRAVFFSPLGFPGWVSADERRENTWSMATAVLFAEMRKSLRRRWSVWIFHTPYANVVRSKRERGRKKN